MRVTVEDISSQGDLYCKTDDGLILTVDPYVTGAIPHEITKESLVGKTFEMEDNPLPYLVLPKKFTEVEE